MCLISSDETLFEITKSKENRAKKKKKNVLKLPSVLMRNFLSWGADQLFFHTRESMSALVSSLRKVNATICFSSSYTPDLAVPMWIHRIVAGGDCYLRKPAFQCFLECPLGQSTKEW